MSLVSVQPSAKFSVLSNPFIDKGNGKIVHIFVSICFLASPLFQTLSMQDPGQVALTSAADGGAVRDDHLNPFNFVRSSDSIVVPIQK